MSAVIETFLTCDGNCGCNYGVDNRGRTVGDQREHAREDGWRYSRGKDYCPDCKTPIERIKYLKQLPA